MREEGRKWRAELEGLPQRDLNFFPDSNRGKKKFATAFSNMTTGLKGMGGKRREPNMWGSRGTRELFAIQ